jgi:hypothetical protein
MPCYFIFRIRTNEDFRALVTTNAILLNSKVWDLSDGVRRVLKATTRGRQGRCKLFKVLKDSTRIARCEVACMHLLQVVLYS